MADKQCADCGEVNEGDANFCLNCGASEFSDLSLHLASRLADDAAPSVAVRLSSSRVILLSVVSSGLYLFYWFYLTWKQLDDETSEEHNPVWHALTLVVPIYGLFRMHAHVRVINEFGVRQGLTGGLAPGLAVVLLVIREALGLVGILRPDAAILVLLTISLAVTTALIVSAQDGLNRAWAEARGSDLADARIGVGEVILAVLGVLLWLSILVLPRE